MLKQNKIYNYIDNSISPSYIVGRYQKTLQNDTKSKYEIANTCKNTFILLIL